MQLQASPVKQAAQALGLRVEQPEKLRGNAEALALLREMDKVGHLHKKQVERAGFAVLRAPDIPSVLVETAFISNPEEERKLRTAAYQSRLADALLVGVRNYFAANPPLA